MQHDYTYYYISTAIIYALILITTWVTVKNWSYLSKTKESIFLPFLCFTIVIELISNYYVWILVRNASIVLDFYTLIAMLFTIYWFYSYLRIKWLAIISSILMITSYLISVYYVESYVDELPAIVIAAALIITPNVFIFFNKMLLNNKVKKYTNHRPFWITIGLFVFHINAMPLVLFLPNLKRLTWQVSGVLVFINLIMYGCFIYALSLKSARDE
ncbi:hypothetical protein LY01_01574 [Nonlabens xylanidelens]|uniref:YhhN-like protein n=1 Tax=Nonlabens xylanidelens TaxID=191564 RepID=A0A2S6IKX4_9FLAO|nr:hypothetical protein [Nonlabens xylanidelens]PPK94821.1 hypothetical protein LY01_01574 [Nonlabens xylanidelens]PQJ17378.1 hypothetical protein BST94_09955 [Nonlabens xylanidelens]